MTRAPVILFIIAALIAGGYWVYSYIKQSPPSFLVEWVKNSSSPMPLPQGTIAPLTVPEGFVGTIYSREASGARVLARDPKGTLVASLTGQGKVVALPDLDSNGEADEIIVILERLNKPHGILFLCPDTGNASAYRDACRLFVAETDKVVSYAYDADTYSATGAETLTDLPSGWGHFTRTLLMHPDGNQLLVSVGSSCNVCREKDERRAAILSIDINTRQTSGFAHGLRNTVFMATDPVTGAVWGTDNGRDYLGDDIPPDEVNIIKKGGDYGWPTCYGKNMHDSDFDKNQYIRDPCADKVPSHIDIQAHSAALGLAFIPEEGWPADMRNDLLIAYHGSWNRTVPTGYKVVRFDLNARDRSVASLTPLDFMTGFIPTGTTDEGAAIGRPVGLLAEPGGVLYVSDDRAGAIYKVAWKGE